MVALDQAGAGAASVRMVAPSPTLRRVQHVWVETSETAGVRLQPWSLPALFDVAAAELARQRPIGSLAEGGA